jgi:hypothetical protein
VTLTPYEVSDVVTRRPSQRSAQEYPGKTMVTEKRAVCENTGKQEGDVTLDHHKQKNGIDSIPTEKVIKKIQRHIRR